ncbi:hypothetical protein B5F77_12580 [Parabacteroides sp. An277]|nr:hypothetical protein B5F77_12580 [Parabacteroides sp. An277]
MFFKLLLFALFPCKETTWMFLSDETSVTFMFQHEKGVCRVPLRRAPRGRGKGSGKPQQKYV